MDKIGPDISDIEKTHYKKRKKGVSSHGKGKTGEKTIVDILKKHSGLFWMRIPNSGATLGQSNRDRIFQMSENQIDAFLGDIFPPLELKYRWIIESKNYATFPFKKFDNFVAGKDKIPAQLDGWIDEFQYDTETYLMSKYTREPFSFLFMKITGHGQWIVGNATHFSHMYPNIQYPPGTKTFNKKPFDALIQRDYGMTWFFADAKEFVALNEKILFI